MSRKLLTSAKNYLATASNVRVAHLVRLELASSTVQQPEYSYLTDYHSNIVYNNKTYEAGKVTKVGDIRQSQGLTNYKLSIDVAGEYPEELIKGLVENLENSYVGRDVEVLRAYLNDDGTIIDFNDINGDDVGIGGEPMQYFIGDITDINITEQVVNGTSKVTWKCAGRFQDFEKVNGRITDDTAHRGLVADGAGNLVPSDGAKIPSHQTDTGFQHAAQTINVVTKYTVDEKRYRLKSRGFFKSDKLIEYTEEVEKTLELGIDLAAQYIPKIYGVRKVSGIPIFIDTLKSDPRNVYVVYAFAEGEIDSFLNFYIDDQPLVCGSEADQDDKICLGNQANGDTVSAFMSDDASGEYINLLGELVQSGRDDSSLYIPPIPQVVGVSRTEGTKHLKVGSGGNNGPTETISYFTITNETGTKEISAHHGLPDQNANQEMVAIAAAGGFSGQDAWLADNPGKTAAEYWDDNCRLLDTAYLVMKYAVSEEENTLPELDAVISGSKVDVYDANGVVSTEKQYTLNPVWHLLDYMTSPVYGGGVDITTIDIKSFYDVATEIGTITSSYDNEFLTYWRYVGWKTEPIPQSNGDDPQKAFMQCNILLQTENTLTKNVSGILKQFDATLNLLGSKYHLSIENDAAPILNIDISDVIGSVTTKDTSDKSKWNAVQASIIDPSRGWTSTQINFFNSEYLEKDNGVRKKGNIAFNHLTNYYTAREWAERQLKRSRFSRQLSFTTYHKFLELYPNANITFTYPRFWDTPKLFRVTNTTMKADGKMAVTLDEYDSDMFSATNSDDNSGEAPPTPVSVGKPSNLEYVKLPSSRFDISTLATENVHGILVWEDPLESSNIARYDVRDWQEVATDYTVPYTQTIIDTGDSNKEKHYILITNIALNTSYDFKVRTIGKVGRGSKYAVLPYTSSSVEDPVTFEGVTNLIATNVDANGVFDGGTVSMSWDVHLHPRVNEYHIEVSDENGTVVSTVTRDQNGNIGTPSTGEYFYTLDPFFNYTIDLNKLNYADNNSGNLGAYRGVRFRVRAASGHGPSAVFSEWKTLII